MTRNQIIFFLFLTGCGSYSYDQDFRNIKTQLNAESSLTRLLGDTLNITKPIRIKAPTNDIFEEDTVETTIADKKYILYPYGDVSVTIISTSQKINFQLKSNNIIETAYFLDYEGNLIVYYGGSDGEDYSSHIECYDTKKYKLKWKNSISGFNWVDPIVIGNMTYIATIGFVGKLNLDNGKYQWQHDNLYDRGKFNAFDSIELKGDSAIFVDNGFGRVIVDDSTGKIINIE